MPLRSPKPSSRPSATARQSRAAAAAGLCLDAEKRLGRRPGGAGRRRCRAGAGRDRRRQRLRAAGLAGERADAARQGAHARASPRWRSATRTISPRCGPISSRSPPTGSSRWRWSTRGSASWCGTASERLLGTNPMAFACPRPGRLPLVWDQASSVMAQGEVLLAARAWRAAAGGCRARRRGPADHATRGRCSTAARSMPFAGHKGSSIAFMIEIMAGALTGGCFGFEDRSARISRRADPESRADRDPDRPAAACPATAISSASRACSRRSPTSGVERLPADRRYARRERALRDGIEVSDRDWATLHELLA